MLESMKPDSVNAPETEKPPTKKPDPTNCPHLVLDARGMCEWCFTQVYESLNDGGRRKGE
jgi:hypothetical protein